MSRFDAADEIAKLDPTDPQYKDYIRCIIKKEVHGEKFSIYHRIFLDLKYGPRKPRAFKKHVKYLINAYIKGKTETHKEFHERPITKQMYGYFDWKKTPRN